MLCGNWNKRSFYDYFGLRKCATIIQYPVEYNFGVQHNFCAKFTRCLER